MGPILRPRSWVVLAASVLFAVGLIVVLSQGSSPVSGQEIPTCNGLPATIVGTEGRDILTGTDGPDVIVGLGGNDVIRGMAGDDTLCGGNGRDRLFGGEGNDVVLGGKKNDIVKGDQGRDVLHGNQGNDRVFGGGAADILEGGSGRRDKLLGKGGTDRCVDRQNTTIVETCETVEVPGQRTFGPMTGVLTPDRNVAQAIATLDSSDPDLSPNDGLEIELDGSSTFTFESGVWTAAVTDGDGVVHESRLGSTTGWFVENGTSIEFSFAPDVSEDSRSWAEWVLGSTPGLTEVGDVWRLVDADAFAAILTQKPLGGTWIFDGPDGLPLLFDDLEFRYVYVVEGDGYVWVGDDVANRLTLFVAGHDGTWIDAGFLDTEGDGRFRPRPGLEASLGPSIDRALAAIGLRAGQGQSLGWGVVGRLAGGVWDAVTPDLPQLATGAYNTAAGTFTLDSDQFKRGLGQLGGAVANDSVLDYLVPLAALHDCGRPGPGHRSSGAGRPDYPAIYESTRGPLMSSEERGLANLARAWMPAVRLSKGEQCGEVIRVLAQVTLYGEDGSTASTLPETARAQITYTVFLRTDGGMPAIKGANGHPGDNEGFSVGLVRSEREDGRCGLSIPNFQLYGGKSAAHKDFIPYVFELEEDTITAAEWAGTAADPTGECPAIPPSWGKGLVDRDSGFARSMAAGDPYDVWVSMSKHGIYFSEGRCDVALSRTEECHRGRPAYDLSRWVELINPPTDAGCSGDSSDVLWPPAEDRYRHGDSWLTFSRVPYICKARHAGGNYDVPGLKTADHAPVAKTTEQVPDVRGETWESARSILEAAGFDPFLGPSWPVTDPAQADRVVDTTPPPNSWVLAGSSIAVVLGELQSLQVPDVRGETWESARSILEAAGFDPFLGPSWPVTDPAQADRVVDTSPPPNSWVLAGSSIAVVLGELQSVHVPDVFGLTETQARNAIQAAGLVFGGVTDTIELVPGDVDIGKVWGQNPVPHSSVPAGTTVFIGIYSEAVLPDMEGFWEMTFPPNNWLYYIESMDASGNTYRWELGGGEGGDPEEIGWMWFVEPNRVSANWEGDFGSGSSSGTVTSSGSQGVRIDWDHTVPGGNVVFERW